MGGMKSMSKIEFLLDRINYLYAILCALGGVCIFLFGWLLGFEQGTTALQLLGVSVRINGTWISFQRGSNDVIFFWGVSYGNWFLVRNILYICTAVFAVVLGLVLFLRHKIHKEEKGGEEQSENTSHGFKWVYW
jgi:hypothetical protein